MQYNFTATRCCTAISFLKLFLKFSLVEIAGPCLIVLVEDGIMRLAGLWSGINSG